MNEEKFEGFFAQISAVQEEMKARNVLRETNTKLAGYFVLFSTILVFQLKTWQWPKISISFPDSCLPNKQK